MILPPFPVSIPRSGAGGQEQDAGGEGVRDMDMYVTGDQLKLSAENLPEFYRLLKQAKKEAEQLNQTIAQLSCFEFSIGFSVADHAGDMEAASSTVKTIPTQ